MKKTLLTVILISNLTFSQTNEWKTDVEKMLGEFLTCGGPTPPNTPCNVFLARALKRVYGISDFDKPNGEYLRANEIARYLKLNGNNWTFLGKASEQKTLTEAQGYANVKKAVIAVYENPLGTGHVAFILPGNLTSSGSWGLNCPNSASFELNNPSSSFVSKPLSFAFNPQLKDKVLLYGRNF